MIEATLLHSPVGPLVLAARAARVCLLEYAAAEYAEHAESAELAHWADRRVSDGVRRTLERWYPRETITATADPAGAASALRAYFAGDLDVLDRIEVELNGTAFQRRVWDALRGVPAGTACSYGELARRIGAPSAVRAVGAANGANPVAIIVPCHRIVGADGTLTGYGGGLNRKRWLLEHEAAQRGLFAGR